MRRIFVKDPQHRIPIVGISQHPWFVQDLSTEIPLGSTQPVESDAPDDVQGLDEIDAIVKAAKHRVLSPSERTTEEGASTGGDTYGFDMY